jgi:nucleotide-binding universal stress UspA family protein
MRVVLAHDGSSRAAEAAALTEAIPWPSGSVLRVVTMMEPILSPMSGPWDRASALSPELDAAIAAAANETLGEVVERLRSSGRSVDGSVVRGRAASTIIDHPWTTGIAPTMYGQVPDAYAVEPRESKAQHQRIAADAAKRLRESGRRAHSEMRDGDAALEIIAVAEEQGADLIVLGSRGRTGLARLLLGSVARNVLSGSTASVLVVHEPPENPHDGQSAGVAAPAS